MARCLAAMCRVGLMPYASSTVLSANGIDPAARDEHGYETRQLLKTSGLSQVRIASLAQGSVKNNACGQKC